MKLGQNMELGPGIDRILEPLVLGSPSFHIEQNSGAREVYTIKKQEMVIPLAPKYETAKNMRPAPLCASPGLYMFVGFPQLGSQNRSSPRHKLLWSR